MQLDENGIKDLRPESDTGFRSILKLVPKGNLVGIQYVCTKENFPGNLQQVIEWLGDAFCCITGGKTISVDNVEIACDHGHNALDELHIILNDDVSGPLVVCPGQWIVWSEISGFWVMGDKEVHSFYTPVDWLDTSAFDESAPVEPDDAADNSFSEDRSDNCWQQEPPAGDR